MWNRPARILLICIPVASLAGQSPGQQETQPAAHNTAANAAEARSVAGQAKAAANAIEDEHRRKLVLEEIGAVQADAGDLDAAVETAREADPDNFAILSAIGKQLAASNDLAKLQSIIPKLKGGSSSTLFAFIAQGQADKGNFARALRTTTQIQDKSVRGDALAWIAERQAAAGDYSGARKTLDLAKAANPDEYSSPDDAEIKIATAQISRGDLQAGLATLSSAKSVGGAIASVATFADKLSGPADKAAVAGWLENALRDLPPGRSADFARLFAIPSQVKLGQTDRAMQAAGVLRSDLFLRGYAAVGVACTEVHDLPCANAALKKLNAVVQPRFDAEQMILDVTAALLDQGEFEVAAPWLTAVEEHPEEKYTKPEVDLQRVYFLARRGEFEDARLRALKMSPNSLTGNERGEAMRILAVLQTKQMGTAPVQSWASALSDREDRAYALLGIAQALAGIGEVRLPYNPLPSH